MTASPWKIEYDNDTGPYDEYFDEWWTVSNGKIDFKCESEQDAEFLCNLLNNAPPPKTC